MTAAIRAVLFDLDDTLYAERRFAVSGMQAVARACATGEAEERRLLTLLLDALRRGRRGQAFQELCLGEGWPLARVRDMVVVYRRHVPQLVLPAASRTTLEALRGGWRLAIVTNGSPDVQASKVRALGVAPFVDTVIYAEAHGDGRGKPAPEPFLAAAAALGAVPERCVFVGNDPRCDVGGARALGMRTIRIRRGIYGRQDLPAQDEADAVAGGVHEVPTLAPALLDGQDALCA